MGVKSPIRPVVSPGGVVLHRPLHGGLALFVVGDRAFRLRSGARSGYGRFVKSLRGAPRRDRKIRGPTPPARLVFCNHWENLHVTIAELLKQDVVRGDGGYLIELERRGYVDSGSRREKVGTRKGSGTFYP